MRNLFVDSIGRCYGVLNWHGIVVLFVCLLELVAAGCLQNSVCMLYKEGENVFLSQLCYTEINNHVWKDNKGGGGR